MEALDRALLEWVYIPLSRFAGRRWGSTACSLSRACIAPMVVLGVIWDISRQPTHAAVGIASLVILATVFWLQAGGAANVPNPYSHQPRWRRWIWFWLTIGTDPLWLCGGKNWLYIVAMMGSDIACLSVVYFRAVPAPPAKREKQPRLSVAAAGA